MDIDRIEELARKGDISPDACAIRLRAARKIAGLTQSQVADKLGRRTQTVNNMENGLSLPSFEVMRYFWRNHRIGITFLMVGDAGELSAEALRQLLPALEEASAAWDQKVRSDRDRSAKPNAQ